MNASWVAIDLMEFAVRTEDAVQSPEAALEWLRSFRDTLLMEGRNSRPMPWAVELLGMANVKIAKKSIARMQGQIVKIYGKDCDVDLECSKKYGEKYEKLKNIIAADTTREGAEDCTCRESGRSTPTNVSNISQDAPHGNAGEDERSGRAISRNDSRVSENLDRPAPNMRRVPQNEAPAHGFSGGDRAAQGPMSRSPEAAAQSGNIYDQETNQVSTNGPAGAGANLDSTHTISPDASSGNAEGVYLHGSVSTSATSGQTITTAETLDKAGAGEVPPENVSAKPSPALPVLSFGEFGNIKMTNMQYAKLCERFGCADTVIEEADQYFEAQPAKKKKYKNHYAMLLNWCKRRETEAKPQQRYKNINDINKENYEKAMREIEAMCAGEAV